MLFLRVRQRRRNFGQGVGLAVIPCVVHIRCAGPPTQDEDILEAGPDRHRIARCVLGAGRRKPTTVAVQPALGTADFVEAERATARLMASPILVLVSSETS